MPRWSGLFLAILHLSGFIGTAAAAPTATSHEYLNLGSAKNLNLVNVLPAWALGATGRGVGIALIDSGIDANHPEFAGRVGGGADFVFGDRQLLDDASGHGTAVAGIIAANHQEAGIVGIAYEARLIPYKVFHDQTGGSAIQVYNAISAAAGNDAVKVLNLSFGGRQPFAGELAVLQNAARNGKFVAVAAGNSAAPAPDFPAAYAQQLGPSVIAVGTLGPDGQIAFFSNRAGPARHSFLLAPGFVVWSTAPGGGFRQVSGSSFSAAYVSGAAALLFDLFPNLSGADVGAILLASADDLGAPGPDAVNGRGRLNIGRAVAPLGTAQVPAGATAGGGGAPLNQAALRVSPAIGAALLARPEALKRAIFLDSFDRAYSIDLSQLVATRPALRPLADLFAAQLEDVHSFTVPVGDGQRLSVGYTPARVDLNRSVHGTQEVFGGWGEFGPGAVALSLTGGSPGFHYRVDLNRRQQRIARIASTSPIGSTMDFIGQHALATPYMGFADREHLVSAGYSVSRNVDFNFSYSLQDDGEAHGLKSSAAALEVSWRALERARLSLRLGHMMERGSLLGGASNGSFSVSRADTRAVGLGATLRLSPKWSAVANMDLGLTSVSDSKNSLLHRFDDLASDAYSVGLLGSGLWRDNDRLGFAVTRPIRVRAGNALLSLPVSMDAGGRLMRESIELNLEPEAQEIDFEAFYRMPIGRRTRIASNLYIARNPGHSRSGSLAYMISASIRHEF